MLILRIAIWIQDLKKIGATCVYYWHLTFTNSNVLPLSVCLLTTLLKNRSRDFTAIFKIGRTWYNEQLFRMQRCSALTLSGISIQIHHSYFQHDDVIKWKHFPRYWPFVRGIHRSRWIPRARSATRSFDVFFDLRLNQWLSKQWQGWWFETPSGPLWRHGNEHWTALITLIQTAHTRHCALGLLLINLVSTRTYMLTKLL